MARITKEFDAFGINYRCKQFDAVSGLEILDQLTAASPQQMLGLTEVEFNCQWHPLADAANINAYVYDLAGVISPLMALRAVMSIVQEFNFGFLATWRGVRIPGRFISGAKSVSTEHAKPLVAQLQQNGTATLKELEEYYSLHDAFKMFDVNVAKGVSEAYAQEAAAKEQAR